MALTAKREAFVREYLIDKNGTQAAIRAGYAPKAANEQAARLLANASVKAAVQAGLQKLFDNADVTAARVIKEIARLGFSDLRQMFDAKGNLKPIHELSDDAAAALASVEVVKKNLTTGDDEIDEVVKLKVWDKPRSLEMLAKHFALLTERIEHGGSITIGWIGDDA